MARPPMPLTIPLISKPPQRASLFSSPPVTAARPAVTIALLKQRMASLSTPLLPLPTTSLSAAPISATLTLAPTQPTGIPATPLLSVPPFPTFQKSPGTIPAPAHSSRLTWATTQPTAQPVFATTRSTAPPPRPPQPAAGVPANAPAAHRLPPVSSAAPARGGPSLRGKVFSAIPMTACATLRTSHYLPPTAFGATFIYFVGRTLRTAALPAARIQALGPAQAAPLLLRPSWRESRRSSIRRLAVLRAIPPPFIISLLLPSTAR